MNVGFREAMRDEDWDCLFFHDVDLIPEDDRNTYVCDNHPKHAAIAMDKFGYKSVFHFFTHLVVVLCKATYAGLSVSVFLEFNLLLHC